MADVFSPEVRSRVMAQVRSQGTRPELAVRRELHALGYRFRLHRRDLPGRPDVVLPKYRLVIFVNGCFWHGHRCRDGQLPTSNAEYWESKIGRNRARDRRATRELNRLGWRVQTIWTCRLRQGLRAALRTLEESSLLATVR